MRIVIVGGPQCGKTTLAERIELRNTKHTDSLTGSLRLDWDKMTSEVVTWYDEPGPWLIEGVLTAHALRSWLRTRQGTPCDVVITLFKPFTPTTKGQKNMTKGIRTVWDEIKNQLQGVRVYDSGKDFYQDFVRSRDPHSGDEKKRGSIS